MRIRTVLAAVGLAAAGLFAGASGAAAYGDVPPSLVHGEFAAHGKYIAMDEEVLALGTYSIENLIHAEVGKHLR
ncbi:hypothetical protein [Streptomyces specialis]|uniref:hypothetical protein n=1 Tax=Streptomyces specialis TaxID=498367 RepID=UPI00073EEF8F|nr:hypothetical protein [Streptomyces specialis]